MRDERAMNKRTAAGGDKAEPSPNAVWLAFFTETRRLANLARQRAAERRANGAESDTADVDATDAARACQSREEG
jgi:hypothetical protein